MSMSKPAASLPAAKPWPTVGARSSATSCMEITTSSRVSTKSQRMRRFVRKSMPIASCNSLSRGFRASKPDYTDCDRILAKLAGRRPDKIEGDTMFTPQSLSIALLMMITSAICWGSWANTYKGVKNYRFELFYWDYAVGIFLISLILALTMGSAGHDANSFLNNVHSADTSNIVYAMIGGAWFNLANLLLVAAIDMAGLAVAFPISIGIALVVGVVLSYVQQPKGNLPLLALGVICALLAVIFDGKAYGNLPASARTVSKKSVITCVVSGIVMGLWAPFLAHSMTRGNSLGPYSACVFLTLGALLSCFIW